MKKKIKILKMRKLIKEKIAWKDSSINMKLVCVNQQLLWRRKQNSWTKLKKN